MNPAEIYLLTDAS